jgi:hypothetical protein
LVEVAVLELDARVIRSDVDDQQGWPLHLVRFASVLDGEEA